MPFSQAQRNVVYPRVTEEATVFLVNIEHEDLDAVIRLTDAAVDIVVEGNTYLSAPFQVVPPGQSEEFLSGRLRVPNVDQRIGEGLDLITGPANVTVTAVLLSDPTVIMGGPHSLLKLQDVQGDALMIEGELNRQQIANSVWPRQWVRVAKYHAVF